MSDTTTPSPQDLATLLASRQRATPNRMTWLLLALALFLGGFAAGAFAHAAFGPVADGGAAPADGGVSGGLSDSFGGLGG